MPRTLIVSNRLPVKVETVHDHLEYRSSEGGLATGLSSVFGPDSPGGWIGWPGVQVGSEARRGEVREALAARGLSPVWLSRSEIRDYYEGFSNEILWPTFHYFPESVVHEPRYWDAYRRVNERFADEVVKQLREGDRVWIHDYQLLLLPQLLRERRPELGIGFFLHIPFPSFELFRRLPWRTELLEGICGADLVGFHTYDYLRHFLDSASRLLGARTSGTTLELAGRTLMADAFPMGIDFERFAGTAASAEVAATARRFRKSFGRARILLSVDRLDYSKGIPQRLDAFRRLLERRADLREKVSLVQIVVPSRDKVGRYDDLREEIHGMVGSINATFRTIDWTPVHHFYRSFPFRSLVALYRMSDVALVTPLRDGMNLVCKEWVASRVAEDGVLVLSELAGAATELPEASLVNPVDGEALVAAIERALDQPREEQTRRISALRRTVRRFDVHRWTASFLERLDAAVERQARTRTRRLPGRAERELAERWRTSERPRLILDYDGTLVGFRGEPQEATPDGPLLELLAAVARHPRARVAVASGRDRGTLERWLGGVGVDLIAEHGLSVRRAGEEWAALANPPNAWKSEVRPLLEQWTSRTPGALVEEKEYSLAWHCRKADAGLAELRMRELAAHLRTVVSEFGLHVLEGHRVVEIRSVEANKGRAALAWLGSPGTSDLLIAIGDDSTDEDLFRALPETAVTIRVGTDETAARWFVDDHRSVRRFLEALAEGSRAAAAEAVRPTEESLSPSLDPSGDPPNHAASAP